MKDRIWETEYEGRTIRVVSRLSFFPPRSSEILEVDGVRVDQNVGDGLRFSAHLRADVRFGDRMRIVEAVIAQKSTSLRNGCHIHVDGELVGGDVKARLNFRDIEKATKMYDQGFSRFIVQRGIVAYGLPYAIMMMFVTRPNTVWQGIYYFALFMIFFGSFMGLFGWKTIKSQVEKARPEM